MAQPKNDREKLEKAYDTIMKMPEGVFVLSHIFELSGYGAPIAVVSPVDGEILALATNYNLSKRDVWCEARRFLSPEQRAEIENPREGK